MTRRAATWKETDLRRAVRVLQSMGLPIAGVEINRDGARVLVDAAGADTAPSDDQEGTTCAADKAFG